ncbi:MAG: DegT/DnrJ/EryC1/StrS family aminotransferase [Planctomycetes bacterium]|nr:DegT/DnrJ/EryC1/StrS family aminotransferase [Planctomycetota bacterium]MCB9909253.1 DegT/DnrJ/EryC1/StrS family aminotransferase [Planctomycetota bacterium]
MQTTQRIADFRSDTVTQPTPAMRQAMAQAEVGDDVLDGDPSVARLERLAADWLGKEGALFVPSGTMANQIALGAHTRPGDEIVVQRFAHVTTFEAGSAGALHGLQTMTLGGLEGSMSAEDLVGVLRPNFIHCPKTALICMEQTHNMAGGRIVPLASVEAIAEVAQGAGIPMHLDGARLANAVVRTGIDARTWCRPFASVSLCLSKGLGAPVGSVLAGHGAFLERARLVRKRLGGWMRQAGHLAEAGRLALEEGLAHLEQDHALAQSIVHSLADVAGLEVEPELVETNMVMVGLGPGLPAAQAAIERLAGAGVRVSGMGPRRLRIVTHRDVGPLEAERLLAALRALARECAAG